MDNLAGLRLFWKDFTLLGGDVDYFVTARLFEGPPAIWPEELEYVRWRHLVATRLDVDPMGIQLVGSARLGYSINPHKDFKVFDNNSDLDIAVISPELFERAWEELRLLIEHQRFNDRKNYLRKLVFEECIALDFALPALSFGEHWSQARDSFAQSLGRPLIDCSINYRLYRSHKALRVYQLKSVNIARDRAIEERVANG